MNEVLISVVKEIEEQNIEVIKEYIVNGSFIPGAFLIIDCEDASTEHNYIIEGGGS